MPGEIWLDSYEGQTTDELIALEETHRIDSLVCVFEQALYQKTGEWTPDERVILAVEALEREVNNGGYALFFSNTPEFAAEIVPALQRIGCPQTAEITARALDALGTESLTEEAVRNAIAHYPASDETLDECTDDYLAGSEDIEGQLFEFIKQYRHNILA